MLQQLMRWTFEGGRPRYFKNEWSKTASDTDILSAVTGTKYSLSTLSYSQSYMSKRESDVIRSEVQKLLSKQVISHCDDVPGEVISPVFTRQKKDGPHRMILT